MAAMAAITNAPERETFSKNDQNENNHGVIPRREGGSPPKVRTKTIIQLCTGGSPPKVTTSKTTKRFYPGGNLSKSDNKNSSSVLHRRGPAERYHNANNKLFLPRREPG